MPDEYDFGTPYCGACQHDLTGLTESARCPECGKPVVDVLVRARSAAAGGRRFASKATIFGYPVLSIATGPTATERSGHARGLIAIGDVATGGLAIGGRARGVVAVGGMSMGVFSLGGMSVGIGTAWGGCAVGGAASGGLCIGILASGGCAVGYAATGGVALGRHVLSGTTRSQDAVEFMSGSSLFFSNVAGGFGIWFMVQPMLFCIGAAAIAAVLIALIALFVGRGAPDEDMTSS